MDTTDGRAGARSRRVELFVRSLASRTGDGPQERAIERLRRLEEAGDVATFRVRVWGRQVGLSTTAVETDRGRDILGRVGAFRDWARRHDVSLAPFFDSNVTASTITGEEYATLRLPVVAMAEFDGDRLVYVTPHEADGTVHTVADRLEGLGRRRPDRESPERIGRGIETTQ